MMKWETVQTNVSDEGERGGESVRLGVIRERVNDDMGSQKAQANGDRM